jgi:hypothetical protein
VQKWTSSKEFWPKKNKKERLLTEQEAVSPARQRLGTGAGAVVDDEEEIFSFPFAARKNSRLSA